MRALRWFLGLVVLLALAAAVPAFFPNLVWSTPEIDAAAAPDPERGKYLLAMGGCASCHTGAGEDAAPLAGGRRLESEFGAFVVPNITPDRETGIGDWSERDFVRAMTVGISPRGRHYYPSFPYTAYTRMSLADLRDLWAHMRTIEPVRNATPAHELGFPWSIRPAVAFWKILYFDAGRFEPDPARSEEWNRGAYIVTGPAHCGECHTPRNIIGGPVASREMGGTATGPDGRPVPNITPHPEAGIGGWTETDLVFALRTGIVPSGDAVGGDMGLVVENTTSVLTDSDLDAVVTYLRALSPSDAYRREKK